MSRAELFSNRHSLMRLTPLVICVPLFLLAACGGGGGGGSSGGSPAPDQPTTDPYEPPDPTAMEPTLASIQEHVFTPICTQCHIGAAAPEGLRLEAGLSHGMLVEVPSSQVPSLFRVEPGNPDDSYLIRKLEGTNSVGERMPFGGPFLEQDVIDIIRQWITDGADAAPAARSPTSFGPEGPGDGIVITGAWPPDGTRIPPEPNHALLIVEGELDLATVDHHSVQVSRLDRLDPVTTLPARVDGIGIEITSLAPTVLRLVFPGGGLEPGPYEIRILGQGPYAVTGRAGQLLHRGDFVLHFEVVADK